MIEVCFYRYAQTCLEIAQSILKSTGVYCLGDYFDEGVLTDWSSVSDRSAAIDVLKCCYCQSGLDDDDREELYAEIFEFYEEQFREFKKAIQSGEDIRVWVAPHARDYCGFFGFCKAIGDCPNRVFLAHPPEYTYNRCERRWESSLGGWGHAFPEDWGSFFRQEELKFEIRQYYAREWDRLIEENSSHRILLNGKVVSVEDDCFDDAILAMIPTEPTKERTVLGDATAKYALDLAFAAGRIQSLWLQGKVIVEEYVPDEGYQFPNKIRRAE